MILIKLCLCTPFSNATLERFFNHLKVVKMELRSRLLGESLNSLMRIRMRGLSITDFNKDYSSQFTPHNVSGTGMDRKLTKLVKKSERSTSMESKEEAMTKFLN